MLAKVTSCAVVGLDGAIVDVEVDVSNGQPGFTIVGLPDAAVQESRERVRAAIKNSSFAYPFNKRITVNLAPADLRKEGPAYDLPMAALARMRIQYASCSRPKRLKRHWFLDCLSSRLRVYLPWWRIYR